MNILLSCLSFKNFTGSEIYFYELATALQDLGHQVSVFSRFTGEPLQDKTNNITFLNKEDIKNRNFDKVIFSHGIVMWDYLKNVKSESFTNIIHSEVLDLEQPILDKRVTKYVGIRPSIVEKFDIKCDLIYNPFDFSRFNPIKNRKLDIKNKVVLFPGSIDYLRVNVMRYLFDLSEKQNFKILHVGRDDYNLQHKNFQSIQPQWHVEDFYKKCDIVSGIFLGRTSIEGLLSGKKVLQFDVTDKGKINKVYWHTEDNLDKFERTFVAKNIIDES